jgi:GNAT superfamily N-acetyltransferase
MYELISARYITETEIWHDTTLNIDPLVIELTPRIELLGVDAKYVGQGVGTGPVRAAEAHCIAQHGLTAPPWHADYARRVGQEGFEEGALVLGLDTSWDQHTVGTTYVGVGGGFGVMGMLKVSRIIRSKGTGCFITLWGMSSIRRVRGGVMAIW